MFPDLMWLARNIEPAVIPLSQPFWTRCERKQRVSQFKMMTRFVMNYRPP